MYNRSFNALWTGQSLANLADVLYVVVVISMIYMGTGKASYAALVPLFTVIAQSLSGLLAPLLFHKLRLRTILLYVQLAKTILLFLLLLLAHHQVTPATLAEILALTFSISFLDGWMTPARNALLPLIVEDKCLVRANSLFSATDQTVQMVSWAFGAMLVASLGGPWVLWVTFLCYIVASVTTLLIHNPSSPSPAVAQPKWAVIQSGWVTIWKTPILRIVSIMDVLELLAGGVWIGALILVYVHEVLHRGETWWGYINAAYLAGSILGGLFAMWIAQRIHRNLLFTMVIGSGSFAILTFLFAFTSGPWVALSLSVLMGPFYTVRNVAQRTIFQTNVDKDVLANVFSAQGVILYASFGVSVLLMSFIADNTGIQVAYVVSSVLLAASAGLAAWKRRDLAVSAADVGAAELPNADAAGQ